MLAEHTPAFNPFLHCEFLSDGWLKSDQSNTKRKALYPNTRGELTTFISSFNVVLRINNRNYLLVNFVKNPMIPITPCHHLTDIIKPSIEVIIDELTSMYGFRFKNLLGSMTHLELRENPSVPNCTNYIFFLDIISSLREFEEIIERVPITKAWNYTPKSYNFGLKDCRREGLRMLSLPFLESQTTFLVELSSLETLFQGNSNQSKTPLRHIFNARTFDQYLY